MSRLRHRDVGGANVTIPHKQAVLQHLDIVDPDAVRARAVNTIAREGDRLAGSNTDIAAIRGAIATVGLEPKGPKAVILGAAGTARPSALRLRAPQPPLVSHNPPTP